MSDKEPNRNSIWVRFLDFFSQHKTELNVIAFLTAFHFCNKYFFKPKGFRDDPSSIPESCPGPGTETAGLSSSCEGCPNKNVCSSNNPNSSSFEGDHNNCLKDVENVIIVASGKGGVGKSTVATQVAFSLDHLGKKVGLLDVDITGPSVPSMTGTTNQEVFESLLGWTPVYVNENLSVMSIGYLMNNHESCISWRGAKKDALIKKFLTSVNWGQLDYLIIDTPPGTSDEHITLVNTLKQLVCSGPEGLDGWKKVKSVLVTTPQNRAIDDVRRTAQFCNDLKINIVMLVENMTNSFLDHQTPTSPRSPSDSSRKFRKDTFRRKKENVDPVLVDNSETLKELCTKFNIDRHFRVDSDSVITQAGESGSFLSSGSPFLDIAKLILQL